MSQLPLLHGTPPASWSNPDAVYTPAELAAFLVALLPWDGIETLLEPSAGGGAFVDAAPVAYTVMCDTDPHCRAASLVRSVPPTRLFLLGDFLTMGMGRFDRAIGNVPYSNIVGHVERALELCKEVAFLLPLGLLEGSSGAWLASTPLRKVWVLRERPFPTKVRGCGFFWWQHGYEGPTEIVPGVSWKNPATFSVVDQGE